MAKLKSGSTVAGLIVENVEGSQSKADEAESNAKDYTDDHENKSNPHSESASTNHDNSAHSEDFETTSGAQSKVDDHEAKGNPHSESASLADLVASNIDYDDTDFPENASTTQQALDILSDSVVVDEGSTADGDYIRYENGWQIFFREDVFDTTTWSSQHFDFPNSYISNRPQGNFSLEAGTGVRDIAKDIHLELGSSDWIIFVNERGDSEEEYINFSAISRWK